MASSFASPYSASSSSSTGGSSATAAAGPAEVCALWALLPALVQGRLVQLACCCPNTLGLPVLELLTGALHCCPLASASER